MSWQYIYVYLIPSIVAIISLLLVNIKGTDHYYHELIIGAIKKNKSKFILSNSNIIGKRCLLPASCMIAGSVTLEDDVWIGPNANISSQLTVEKGAYITLGCVVTRNVSANQKVTGNFAIPHDVFMKNLKISLLD